MIQEDPLNLAALQSVLLTFVLYCSNSQFVVNALGHYLIILVGALLSLHASLSYATLRIMH